MSTAVPAAAACPLCRQPLPDGRGPCPHCDASPDWIEMGQAIDFALRRLTEWSTQGRVSQNRLQDITDYYERQREACGRLARDGRSVPDRATLPAPDRCWSCGDGTDPPPEFCAECGAPWDTAGVRSLRFWTFLGHEIDRHGADGRLSLNQSHDLATEVRQRIASLRQKLEKERLPAVTAVTAAEPPPRRRKEKPARDAAPRRSAWEILLDPRTIQWLLGFGGALLVFGLVIWLAAAGFFQDPRTVAVALGLGNAAALGAGWAVLTRTRYQTAGRALTLLACLVMPLNLWFYHAQGLVTLDGHLWVAALVCCAVYAASALLLRDHLFVHILLGGVALTGLLILADMHKFEEIAAPSALLVILGLAAIHVERAFPEGEGPFTRSRFGLAFFQSGHVLLAAGLLLLLGGQIAGWLVETGFHPRGLDKAPDVVTFPDLQLLAIGLVLAATYAYVYSDVVVRRVGAYIYPAVFTLLWAEVLIVIRLGLTVREEVVILVLAGTALLAHVLHGLIGGERGRLARALSPLGVFLSSLPVALGVLLHYRAANVVVHDAWPYEISWSYVAAMALTAVTCRYGAYLTRRELPWVSTSYFFGAAAATLAGAAGLLTLFGLTWDQQAVVVVLIPAAYLIASRLYRGHTAERPLVWVAHVALSYLVAGALAAALHLAPQVERLEPITGQGTNLLLALFCAEAAVVYGLAAGLRKDGWCVYPATAMACGAVWQLLNHWQVAPEYYVAAFALLGFALLVAYRLAVLERFQTGGLAAAAFGSANVLMSLSFVAAALLAMSRVAVGQVQWSMVPLLLALAALSLVAAGLVRHRGWRPWYVVMSVVEALLMFVALEFLSTLTVWQKAEIFCIIVGVLLVLLGYWGWYREQSPDVARQSELVTLALLFGSLLTAVPLAVAVLSYRAGHTFSAPNELGMLAAGIVLLGSGFACQIKSTTLAGASLMVLYVLTLAMFIHDVSQVQAAALLIAVGGGLVFGLGLLLSVYRDRLLALPEKVRRREGVFRVLTWR